MTLRVLPVVISPPITHDQYTTMVRSKTAQFVINHLKNDFPSPPTFGITTWAGGKFADATESRDITKTNGHYCFEVSTLDYNRDGWPDIYVACDSSNTKGRSIASSNQTGSPPSLPRGQSPSAG